MLNQRKLSSTRLKKIIQTTTTAQKQTAQAESNFTKQTAPTAKQNRMDHLALVLSIRVLKTKQDFIGSGIAFLDLKR